MASNELASDREIATVSSIIQAYDRLLVVLIEEREFLVDQRLARLLSDASQTFSDRVKEVQLALRADGPALDRLRAALGKEGLSGIELELKVETVRRAFDRKISTEVGRPRSVGYYAGVGYDRHRQKFIISDREMATRRLHEAGRKDPNVWYRFGRWLRRGFHSGAPVI